MKKCFSIAMLLFSSLFMKAYSADYYVDPANGNMSNPGTQAQPWSTLAAVMASNFNFAAGDNIYLFNGNHGDVTINKRNTGTVYIKPAVSHKPTLNNLIFTGAAFWEVDGVHVKPVVAPSTHNAGSPKPINFLVRMYKNPFNTGIACTNITLRNMQIFSAPNADMLTWVAADWNTKAWSGIDVSQASANVLIENCRLYNLEWGIYLWGDLANTTLRGNTVENLCGDGVWINVSDVLMEYNTIKNFYNTKPDNHYDMIQAAVSNQSNPRRNIIIRGNTLINAIGERAAFQPDPGARVQGMGLFDGYFENWTIENNVVITNNFHGISLFNAINSKIVNNTILMNPKIPDASNTGATRNAPGIRLENKTGKTYNTSNVLVRNNIANDFVTAGGVTSADYTADHNYIATHGNFPYTSTFEDYQNYNVKLKQGATNVINAGSDTDVPTIDMEKTARVSPYDMGAYEFQDGSLPVLFGKIEGWINEDDITIKWESVEEINVSHYEVQLSKDGTQFSQMAIIKSQSPNGYSLSPLQYEYREKLSKISHSFFTPFVIVLLLLLLLVHKKNKAFAIVFTSLALFIIIPACRKKQHQEMEDNKTYYFLIKQIDIDGKSRVSNVFKLQRM